MLRYKEFILETKKPFYSEAFTFDNFSLGNPLVDESKKYIKFPEIEDLDMYLQLIEDDGYKYNISKYIGSEFQNSRNYIDEVCDKKFNIKIEVMSGELLKVIEDTQKIYKLFIEKYSDKWDLKAESYHGGVKIYMEYKESPKSGEIYGDFIKDVSKFMEDNNVKYESSEVSNDKYDIIYMLPEIKDMREFKINCEKFVNESGYLCSIEKYSKEEYVIFSLIVPILNLTN